jgi:hypothetical protein
MPVTWGSGRWSSSPGRADRRRGRIGGRSRVRAIRARPGAPGRRACSGEARARCPGRCARPGPRASGSRSADRGGAIPRGPAAARCGPVPCGGPSASGRRGRAVRVRSCGAPLPAPRRAAARAAAWLAGLFGDLVLLFGPALEDAKPGDDADRDGEPEREGEPEQAAEIAPQLGLAQRDLDPLRGEVVVVQFLDLDGQPQHRPAPGQHLGAQEGDALGEVLLGILLEERLVRAPVFGELALERGDLAAAARRGRAGGWPARGSGPGSSCGGFTERGRGSSRLRSRS